MQFRGVKVILRDGLNVTDKVRRDMFNAWQDLQILHSTQPGLQYKCANNGKGWRISSLSGRDQIELLGYVKKKEKFFVRREERKKFIAVRPYLFASENSFDRGGVLVCLGGLNFSGGYKLLSPYGNTSLYPLKAYQPYSYLYDQSVDTYTFFSGWEHINYTAPETLTVVKYMIPNYYALSTLWDELPWMGDNGYDPVYYESYLDYMNTDGEIVNEKPYKIEWEIIIGSESDTDNTVLIETSEEFELLIGEGGPWTGSFYLYHRTAAKQRQTDFTLGEQTLFSSTYSYFLNHIYSAGGPGNVDYPTWWAYSAHFGEPPPPVAESTYHWESVRNTKAPIGSAYDQTDLTKYGVVYTNHHTTTTFISIDEIGHETVITYYDVFFKGLGHTKLLFRSDHSVLDACVRLYNIGGIYTCLFSVNGSETKVVGSATEGGELNILDVTDGLEFEGELRTICAGTSSFNFNTLGMISWQESAVVTKEII